MLLLVPGARAYETLFVFAHCAVAMFQSTARWAFPVSLRLNPDDTVHYRYGASTYCARVTLSHLLHLLAHKFIIRDYLLVIDYNVLSR